MEGEMRTRNDASAGEDLGRRSLLRRGEGGKGPGLGYASGNLAGMLDEHLGTMFNAGIEE